MQRVIIKKCFFFTAESVCRVKRFTTASRNSFKDVRISQVMPDQVALLRMRKKQQQSKNSRLRVSTLW
jgi:hypothetical protein